MHEQNEKENGARRDEMKSKALNLKNKKKSEFARSY